jgi:hypothetical protein
MRLSRGGFIPVLVVCSASAHAFCPPGSRQVQNGYAITCVCPDGSLGSIYGCPQLAPVQSPRAPAPRASTPRHHPLLRRQQAR